MPCPSSMNVSVELLIIHALWISMRSLILRPGRLILSAFIIRVTLLPAVTKTYTLQWNLGYTAKSGLKNLDIELRGTYR